MIGSSVLVDILHKFYLACNGSLWQASEFGIVSVIYGILKSSSFIKLKPTLFPEGYNSISYVIIVVSLNGVDVRLSSHGVKFRRSGLRI